MSKGHKGGVYKEGVLPETSGSLLVPLQVVAQQKSCGAKPTVNSPAEAAEPPVRSDSTQQPAHIGTWDLCALVLPILSNVLLHSVFTASPHPPACLWVETPLLFLRPSCDICCPHLLHSSSPACLSLLY